MPLWGNYRPTLDLHHALRNVTLVKSSVTFLAKLLGSFVQDARADGEPSRGVRHLRRKLRVEIVLDDGGTVGR